MRSRGGRRGDERGEMVWTGMMEGETVVGTHINGA